MASKSKTTRTSTRPRKDEDEGKVKAESEEEQEEEGGEGGVALMRGNTEQMLVYIGSKVNSSSTTLKMHVNNCSFSSNSF